MCNAQYFYGPENTEIRKCITSVDDKYLLQISLNLILDRAFKTKTDSDELQSFYVLYQSKSLSRERPSMRLKQK